MKVITLLNEKGGVGKTTLATHLAAGLAILGHRVVCVDSDPQANATSTFGYDKRPHFYDLCIRGDGWSDVLRPVHPDMYAPETVQQIGQLWLVSSNHESRSITTSLQARGILLQRLRQLQKTVDYVIIDTSPTPSLLNETILLATDYVLIPTNCESFSAFEGVPDSIRHTLIAEEALQEYDQLNGPRVLGIVPNMVRTNTALHRDVLEALQEEHGALVWDAIPLRTAVGETQVQRQFLFPYPELDATEIMWTLVKRVVKELAHV